VTVEILQRYLDMEGRFFIGWLMQFPGGRHRAAAAAAAAPAAATASIAAAAAATTATGTAAAAWKAVMERAAAGQTHMLVERASLAAVAGGLSYAAVHMAC
jgi:hypothetical protein